MPLILKLTKTWYPRIERFFPRLAHKWAISKFSTPFHFPPKSNEKHFIDQAEKYEHGYRTQKVMVYEWNKGKEKSILLSHGWSGRGGQFWAIIPELVKAGYHVITFDSLAHGRSEGKQTHLWDFQKIIEQLSIKNGGFHFLIGHSLGGVACALALNKRAKANGLVTINSPSISKEMIEAFVNTINGSEKLMRYFRNYIEDNFGVTLEDYELRNVIPQLLLKEKRVVTIADKNDMDVPFRHSQLIVDENPEVKHFFTEGLGHNKILGDQEMIRFVINQLNQ